MRESRLSLVSCLLSVTLLAVAVRAMMGMSGWLAAGVVTRGEGE